MAIQSFIGFIGDFQNETNFDWQLLIGFSFCSILGTFIGNFMTRKSNTQNLKTAFGWFVLFIGIAIFIKEVF